MTPPPPMVMFRTFVSIGQVGRSQQVEGLEWTHERESYDMHLSWALAAARASLTSSLLLADSTAPPPGCAPPSPQPPCCATTTHPLSLSDGGQVSRGGTALTAALGGGARAVALLRVSGRGGANAARCVTGAPVTPAGCVSHHPVPCPAGVTRSAKYGVAIPKVLRAKTWLPAGGARQQPQ